MHSLNRITLGEVEYSHDCSTRIELTKIIL
jgi:hypothetical protein